MPHSLRPRCPSPSTWRNLGRALPPACGPRCWRRSSSWPLRWAPLVLHACASLWSALLLVAAGAASADAGRLRAQANRLASLLLLLRRRASGPRSWRPRCRPACAPRCSTRWRAPASSEPLAARAAWSPSASMSRASHLRCPLPSPACSSWPPPLPPCLASQAQSRSGGGGGGGCGRGRRRAGGGPAAAVCAGAPAHARRADLPAALSRAGGGLTR